MGEMSHSFQIIIDAFRNENNILEEYIKEKNIELEAQYKYILESEKASLLGTLVAGVAHEVNTPIGVCISLTSYLEKRNKDLKTSFIKGGISKTSLNDFLIINTESLELLTYSINSVADMVSSFKSISTAENLENRSSFNLCDTISDSIRASKYKCKSRNINITSNCSEDIIINSYQRSFLKIFTALITNSVNHAFQNFNHGNIHITVSDLKDNIEIYYSDDGNGISDEHLSKIFDPFFTTTQTIDNMGLGLRIIYNIITQLLKGTIKCESELGKGVLFTITIPKEFIL